MAKDASTILALLLTPLFSQSVEAQSNARVSLDSIGNEANDDSGRSSISSNGRFVAFDSVADNLVDDDWNNRNDCFLHDRRNGETIAVSIDQFGYTGSGHDPEVSGDGRFVAFWSWESLSPSVHGSNKDVFLFEVATGAITQISVSPQGRDGNGSSSGFAAPSLSHDGQFTTFHSSADNLVPGDTNGFYDIFVYDRISGQIEIVSPGLFGIGGNGDSLEPSISANGRYVAFGSNASNLVPNDTNGASDIFVYDRAQATMERISIGALGLEANAKSSKPSISGDGQIVAFESYANNLVANDNNGLQDVFFF